MLNITTIFLTFLGLRAMENSWKRQPKEIIADNMPTVLSEKPKSLVNVVKNEPLTKIAIKYSRVASIT